MSSIAQVYDAGVYDIPTCLPVKRGTWKDAPPLTNKYFVLDGDVLIAFGYFFMIYRMVWEINKYHLYINIIEIQIMYVHKCICK